MNCMPEGSAQAVKKVVEGHVFTGLSNLLVEDYGISATMK